MLCKAPLYAAAVIKYEFVHIRLEAASLDGDKAASLQRRYSHESGSKGMPGGATLRNVHSHLAKMGADGWQIVSYSTVPNGDRTVDMVWWLQRAV